MHRTERGVSGRPATNPFCDVTKCVTSRHWENYVSISFHIEWDMIVVTVLFSILNQMEFHLVQNWKENCYHDHIPFNVKGNGNIVFSVYILFKMKVIDA